MTKNNLSEEHDSYLRPIKNISNGKRFSEEISLLTCHFCSKIARFKIMGEYENTVFVCEDHHSKLVKTGQVKPVLKNYTNEKLPLTHKIPDCRSVGIKSFSQFGNKHEKFPKKNNPVTDFILGMIWDERIYLGDHVKVFGDTIPAIRIFYEINEREMFFYFTESGIPLFSDLPDGTIVEYYSGR